MLKYFRKLPNPLGYVAKRTEKWLNGFITRYIASTMENLEKEPALVAAILKKPFRLLVDDMIEHPPAGLDKVGEMGSTGNVALDVGQALLPMFGSKGKKAAQALSAISLLRGKPQSNDSGKNPFDR